MWGLISRVVLVILALIAADMLRRPAIWAHGAPGAPSAQVQASPKRIISLVPAVTEMLFAIGAGPEVVGVSSYDRFPPEARTRPSVGALVDPDFERILSLKPDLVVVYGSQSELITRLERVRIPMFNYRHAGLADITETIESLGARVGRAERARQVANAIRGAIGEVARRVAGRARPKTMLVFGREPGTLRGIYASGGIGFMHDMLDVAGGANIFADVPRQAVQVSSELLLARAPDVVVEVHTETNWTQERIAREQRVWSVLPSVPAVRNGRVHVLVDDRLTIPGPRVAEAVQRLAAVLHPELK